MSQDDSWNWAKEGEGKREGGHEDNISIINNSNNKITKIKRLQ